MIVNRYVSTPYYLKSGGRKLLHMKIRMPEVEKTIVNRSKLYRRLHRIVRNTKADQARLIRCSKIKTKLDIIYTSIVCGCDSGLTEEQDERLRRCRVDSYFFETMREAIEKGHTTRSYDLMPNSMMKTSFERYEIRHGLIVSIGTVHQFYLYLSVGTQDRLNFDVIHELPFILEEAKHIKKIVRA